MKLLASLALFGTALAAQPARPAQGTVTAIRHWSLGEVTRVAVEVSREFEYRLDRLHNPERVYFDILDSRPGVNGKGAYSEQVGDKLVSRIRVAETAPGITRIVLDLAQGVEISTSQLRNPNRLVVELRTEAGAVPRVQTATTALAAPPAAERPKSTTAVPEPSSQSRKEPLTAEPARPQPGRNTGPNLASAAGGAPAGTAGNGRAGAEKNLASNKETAAKPAGPAGPAGNSRVGAAPLDGPAGRDGNGRADAEQNFASNKETAAKSAGSAGPAGNSRTGAAPPAGLTGRDGNGRADAEKNLASNKETAAPRAASTGPAGNSRAGAAPPAGPAGRDGNSRAGAAPPAGPTGRDGNGRPDAEKNLASNKETAAPLAGSTGPAGNSRTGAAPPAGPAGRDGNGRAGAENNLASNKETAAPLAGSTGPAGNSRTGAAPPAGPAGRDGNGRAGAENNLASNKETAAPLAGSTGPAGNSRIGAAPPAVPTGRDGNGRPDAEKNLASNKETAAPPAASTGPAGNSRTGGTPPAGPAGRYGNGRADAEKNFASNKETAAPLAGSTGPAGNSAPPSGPTGRDGMGRADAEKNLASDMETATVEPRAEPAKPPAKGRSAAEKNLATSSSAEPSRTPARSAPLEKIPALEVAEPPAPAPILPPETGKAARPTTTGSTSLVRALGLKIGKIVIDPGHGGHDQGTQGVKGLIEKELVLDVAQRLGKLVEDKLGAEVIYTRSDDTFIPLEGRTALANERKADLFLSIHANSSPVPRITGVETYYLNFTDARDALDVASRENASYEKSVFELQDIIKKIALHEKLEESREFAGRIQTALYQFSSRSIPTSKNRGVRKAPFVVLIGARMPSVLAEIGFLSNSREEALLKKPDYRQKVAEALFRGLQRYAESLSHFQVAQAKD